jgi:hypothetical protein
MKLLPALLLSSFLILAQVVAAPAQPNRWSLAPDGGIAWEPKTGEAHSDHIEMSGKKISVILTYAVDAAGQPSFNRHVVWPMLRFPPNGTRDHLALDYAGDATPRILLNRALPRSEVVTRIHHHGISRIESTVANRSGEIALVRTLYPSADRPLWLEDYTFTNRSAKEVTIELEETEKVVRTSEVRGIYGGYTARARVLDPGEKTVAPGASVTLTFAISAGLTREAEPAIDPMAERRGRETRLASFAAHLQLMTPDPVLNTMFAFAKIRAAESIYATKGGLMHGPGGGAYYAAIWANDQAEYANPFFAMLGDPVATESALNSYRHFARFMNPDYKPIPSSITAEGATFWHGAKDRGDMAMIAYGAARFALAYGDRRTAEELWPLIAWCLEYSRRQTDANGVIASDSDELENRFPSGKANLCTSTLHYDALRSAALLGRDLAKPAGQLAAYTAEADALRGAIGKFFGANVEGFETYRYFDKSVPSATPGALARHAHYANEPDHLRAWICMPLTVDIYDRKDATIAALFSPRLWTPDGLATEAGKETFWDRSTLYALRGVFAAGATQQGLDYLTYYSNRRLLGDHVPYAVEAWPEGNQRHLSAESALYCRIYTEGLFGMRPTGLRSFDLTPRLPAGWNRMTLQRIAAFGRVFDLTVVREGAGLRVELTGDGVAPQVFPLAEGGTVRFSL